MKQCEYEKTRRLMFVVHTREEEEREERIREEKTGEERRREVTRRKETRREERRTSNCEILGSKNLRYFRRLQTQKSRGYTEPNITLHM
jgi:hypothetical protein